MLKILKSACVCVSVLYVLSACSFSAGKAQITVNVPVPFYDTNDTGTGTGSTDTDSSGSSGSCIVTAFVADAGSVKMLETQQKTCNPGDTVNFSFTTVDAGTNVVVGMAVLSGGGTYSGESKVFTVAAGQQTVNIELKKNSD